MPAPYVTNLVQSHEDTHRRETFYLLYMQEILLRMWNSLQTHASTYWGETAYLLYMQQTF